MAGVRERTQGWRSHSCLQRPGATAPCEEKPMRAHETKEGTTQHKASCRDALLHIVRNLCPRSVTLHCKCKKRTHTPVLLCKGWGSPTGKGGGNGGPKPGGGGSQTKGLALQSARKMSDPSKESSTHIDCKVSLAIGSTLLCKGGRKPTAKRGGCTNGDNEEAISTHHHNC